MATTNEQIGAASSARYYGVPGTTITWTGYGSSGGAGSSHSATVFGEISKTPMTDRTQAEDNTGEVQNMRRRNKRIQIRCSARPVAASITAALAIAADLPMQMDIVTITSTDDPQLACDGTPDTGVVDDASARYTPDGADGVIIDFTITIWLGKTLVAQTT